MRELATEDVAEDFSVAMGMGREAGLGAYAVFVEDAKAAKGFEGWVVKAGKGDWGGVRGTAMWD